MAQTADMLGEVDDYLEQQAEIAGKMAITESPGARRIDVSKFLKLHKVIQQRLLHNILCDLTPGGKDITYRHISDLLTLFTDSGNRDISLPHGLKGKRRYGDLMIESKDVSKKDSHSVSGIVPDTCQNIPISETEALVLQVLGMVNLSQEIPTNQYTKWFDYDKIRKSLDLRTRRKGDYLTIADGKGNLFHKSLKDYMIAQKIPREERDNIFLLAEDNHILWVIGYRISEHYKIGRNTKHILQVQLIGKSCENSETEAKDGRAY
jgi:tRNA(Ile)-lysidine synthase